MCLVFDQASPLRCCQRPAGDLAAVGGTWSKSVAEERTRRPSPARRSGVGTHRACALAHQATAGLCRRPKQRRQVSAARRCHTQQRRNVQGTQYLCFVAQCNESNIWINPTTPLYLICNGNQQEIYKDDAYTSKPNEIMN